VQLPPSRLVSVPPASAPPGSDSLPRTRRPASPSKLAAFETLGEGAARFPRPELTRAGSTTVAPVKAPRLSSASNMTASDALGGVGEQEASEKHRALTRLQRAVRHVIQDWLASCSPVTFRTSNPKRPYPLPIFADHGLIQFPARSDPARFIHLADSREPYKSEESYCKSVLDLMEKHWMMEPASVLISITGGAQDFKLQPRLLKAFRHGLAKAAQATNAWVFTGGTDSGVMALVGDALSDAQCSAKMVGICTWASVMGKDRLEGCYGGTREMVREAPNNRNAANLEPHHTHFIMVDNGASPQEAFRDAFAHFLGVPTATVALGVESDKGKPPFKVVATVTAFSEADSLGIHRKLTGLTAEKASSVLPSAIERITKVDTPQPCVCALHATLSPTVTKFDNNTRWGGEIPMRVMLEKLYCERRRVPRVLLVVNGGPGTLQTVRESVMGGCPVVLVSDSGGIATCLADFLKAAGKESALQSWKKKYEAEYVKKKDDRPKWDKIQRAMQEIAAVQEKEKKISSFALSETSTAALDLHVLNAVINDDTQCRAGTRLQLAVQWNRKEVVQSVMLNLRTMAPANDFAAAEHFMRVQVAHALQVAIERQQPEIIKLLFTAQESAVGLLDFLSLYKHSNPFFTNAATLQKQLDRGDALDALGKPTPIRLYREVLLPFLIDYIPGIESELQQELEQSQKAAARSPGDSRRFDEANALFEDALPHLMLWGVFIGRVDIARVFWQHASRQSDPIRLALIASQVSKRAAIARPTAATMYESNADTFEKWACSVLDKCPTQSHATIVLMRPSRTWPGTILQTAMEGESKSFVGHKYVQTLIDEYWRGNLYGSDGALSSSVSSLRVLAHFFVRTIDKQEVELDASAWDNLERKKKASRQATAAFQLADFVAPNRANSGDDKDPRSPPPLAYRALGGRHRLHERDETQELSLSRRDSGAGGSRWGGAGGMATTALDTLEEVPPCCCYPSPFAPGVGLCTRVYNLFACCFNCCGQCCTCLCCLHCFKCLRGLFHIRWLNMRWFLAVPRVKFLLKVVSYFCFLAVYTTVLMSHPGTFTTFGVLELVFAVFCYAFWVEELFQWYTHFRAGAVHFDSAANLMDVLTLTAQALASTVRLTAGPLCHVIGLGTQTIERVVEDRRLGELLDGGDFVGFEAAARRLHAPGGGRALLSGHNGGGGDSGGGGGGPLPESVAGEDGELDALDIWSNVYRGCDPLWYAQVVLAVCAIYAFVRPILWLQIYKQIGVLSIILQELSKDIMLFSFILCLVMAAFCSAMVGIMPSLGESSFDTDGAFALPWWALFGEFGELHNVGVAGGWLGPMLLWTFSFLTQVVLVNLLIAMMSETYEKIKENADNEWKYSRVYVVDEFVSSVFWIPPPFSLPFLVAEISKGMSGLFCSRLAAACRRCLEFMTPRCCRKRSRVLRLGPNSTKLRRMSTSRAQGLGYRRGVKVVPLLSDTLPEAVLDVMARQDLTWLTDLLDEEEREREEMTDTKISALQLEQARVTDKCLEIQESLINLHAHMRETAQPYPGGTMLPFGGSLRAGAASATGYSSATEMTPRHSPRSGSPRGASPVELTSASSTELPRPTAHKATARGGVATAPVSSSVISPHGGDGLASFSNNPLASFSVSPEVSRSPPPPAGGAPIADAALVESLRKQLNDAQRALAAHSTAHVHARSQQNPKYPPRFPVEDAKVSWKVPWPEYSPVPFVAPSVLAAERSDTNPNGWADSPRPNLAELKHRLSCEGPLFFDADQRPVNPRGRTGVCGRGMLGKWGPNRAADPIVTRWKPGDKRKLQIVAIQRGDTGVWALPGGMVDAGEVVSVTVRREFAEEAGNMASDAERAAFNAAVDELFAHGEVVYRGYVDDPRNTDNAWMETTAFHFHCTADLAVQLPLRAGDDAHNVTWLDVDDAEPRYAALYASHKDWVDRVACELRLRKGHSPKAVAAPAEATPPAPQGRRKPQRSMLGLGRLRIGSPKAARPATTGYGASPPPSPPPSEPASPTASPPPSLPPSPPPPPRRSSCVSATADFLV